MHSMYKECNPTPALSPKMLLFNEDLAKEINLHYLIENSNERLDILSGNKLIKDSKPIAFAYSGHQFGYFNPNLGDGRALLLGEILDQQGKLKDIQLKGSGRTPFSRRGDGKSALGPVLREYLISESMHILGIPTTRSLAAINTGEKVHRDEETYGGIMTRVASSHIRIGSFEYAYKNKDISVVKDLADYSISRHFPDTARLDNPYLAFFAAVCNEQASLVASWMTVGFIHGVMNTDNMAISGETIDYGPCAFMDSYDPQTVFSSIDQLGRYAYCNQPKITKWNLTRFAECLIPLIDKNEESAIKMATEIIDEFEKDYEIKWLNMMRDKLGLFGVDSKDKVLVMDLLTWMHQNKVDYTNTFCFLMNEKVKDNKIYKDENFLIWKKRWQERLKMHNNSLEKYLKLMRAVNPLVIPRNQIVEEALTAANNNNLDSLVKLNKILSKPYINQDGIEDYQNVTNTNYKDYKTFCGT